MNLPRRLIVSGRVQGVGYRPFVYRLAHELGLAGTVRNAFGRVEIEAAGSEAALTEFSHRLISCAPPLARPNLLENDEIAPRAFSSFEILDSADGREGEIVVPPDLSMCDDCLAELCNPDERRSGYPFINCTQCGPRYTIIEAMPYDRANTTMREFSLCEACRAEFENPFDRRFHAQPLACPVCGPQLAFVENGAEISGKGEAFGAALDKLKSGGIVAVKGVGGYHLMCDAVNDVAIGSLRKRKRRPAKPFAVMFPYEGKDGLDAVRRQAALDELSQAACASAERPIVLVAKCNASALSELVAPGLAEIGVFLPYAPLQHLILQAFGGPLVATSANISGEPVIIDNDMAEERLGGIADAFLHHNRPIVRPADDSVLRVAAGVARPIRLGRGAAPVEVILKSPAPCAMLAVGGHMKNTIALAFGRRAVISPHIGDLDAPFSQKVFERTIADLQRLYSVDASLIVCDKHKGYASTRWARRQGKHVIAVQHHRAHASALAAELPEISNWLTFVWDGVGLGDNGALWGGEAFYGGPGDWRRVSSFRPFRLVGGDKAAREPWRSAAALLWEEGKTARFASDPENIGASAWRRGANIFESSAAGRLFDAAACMVLGIEKTSYEGEAPMKLEALARHASLSAGAPPRLPIGRNEVGLTLIDWAPLLDTLCDSHIAAADRAHLFHAALADAMVNLAANYSREFPIDAVGLTGGVFQNRILAEMAHEKLSLAGFAVHLPELLPANDGGIALGQIVEAQAVMQRGLQ